MSFLHIKKGQKIPKVTYFILLSLSNILHLDFSSKSLTTSSFTFWCKPINKYLYGSLFLAFPPTFVTALLSPREDSLLQTGSQMGYKSIKEQPRFQNESMGLRTSSHSTSCSSFLLLFICLSSSLKSISSNEQTKELEKKIWNG